MVFDWSIFTSDFLIGMAVGVGAFMAGFGIVSGFMKRKKPNIDFKVLRKEIKEGYEGLSRASQTFHEFNEVLNEVEKR